MRGLLTVGAIAAGAAVMSRRGTRDTFARFRRDVRQGMDARENQLREIVAMDTHLALPGERVVGARAIEGR